VVDRGDMAISNTPVKRDAPGPGDAKHTVTFATTKRMSTYLVALLVGDFECLEDAVDGIPLRVCATPAQTTRARFAMEATKAILAFFNRYYSIKYPFEKLDQIAIPDFMAGAMENTGAIIYRETALLVDDATATPEDRRGVADIISHEIAHQWFGNLVTMAWWNDVWLNEGFASWITAKPLEVWKPDWHVDLAATDEAADALATDAVASTRPIRASEADTPAEIQQLFDGITYGKTAAVLRMIEQYLGPETFRSAVNAYLERHAYANATAEDFWTALKETSGKPVDRVMRTYVVQPGAPLLSLASACASGRQQITVTQQRFFTDPVRLRGGSPELWEVPVCFRTPGAEARCELLSQKTHSFTFDRCAPWVVANAGGRGYYRAEYTGDLATGLASALPNLTPAERLIFLSDQLALVAAERQTYAGYLTMLPVLGIEASEPVARTAFSPLARIEEEILTPAETPAFHSWVRTLLAPQVARIGREPKPDEADDTRTLRALLLRLVADAAADGETIAYLRTLTDAYLANPASVDPALADVALPVAARHGDAALYERLTAALDKASAPAMHDQLERALALFREPALLQRTLQRLLTPAVRNQDLLGVLFTSLANPETRPLVWSFIKDHFEEIESRLGSLSASALVYVPRAFCDATLRDDAARFFEAHPLEGARVTLQQSLERASTCIRTRQREGPILSAWLREQSAGSRP
jgi:aminopeptidase N